MRRRGSFAVLATVSGLVAFGLGSSAQQPVTSASPADVLMRMGRAAQAAGDWDKALTAFSLVYYEFPFSDMSPAAGSELDRLPNRTPIAAGTTRYKLELGRAEQLFGGKRYSQAF